MTTQPWGSTGNPAEGRALAEVLKPPNAASDAGDLDEAPTKLSAPRGRPQEPTDPLTQETRTRGRIECLAEPLGGGKPHRDDIATKLEPIRGTLEASEDRRAPGGALPRGTAVGRYLIVEPLGAGGLGDVYTAYDPELDRRVAVKLLRPSTTDLGSSHSGNDGDRLIREAKAMAQLAHPNVVAVHDVGRIGNEVFIAMERVEGVTLAQWVRELERPWHEIRGMFLGAGAGLAAAHAANLIHRDFKPQNVVIGVDGRPRVLDFGLARSLHREQRSGLLRTSGGFAGIDTGSVSLDAPITLPGTLLGTPQFMAPEQFEDYKAGAPADQFSFCVAMWKALYRVRPFQGDDIAEVIKAVRAGRLTEPKDRRDVPGWLHRVLVRGLSHAPEDRYPSMDALLHALQQDKRSRRRNWFALAVVAVLSAGGAGTAALVFEPSMTEVQRSEVEAIVIDARAAAAKSYFVYPSPEDPDAVTSYRKVLELEAHDGAGEQLAGEQAVALRTEFSSTLTRLGDRYYEREGGRAFAADYYAAALIFEPHNDQARDRTTLTPGEVSMLRDQAATGEFSASELAAAASLKILAIEDEEARVAEITKLFDRQDAPSESTSARLQALLGAAETAAIETATKRKRDKRRAKAASAKAPTPPEPPAKSALPTEADLEPVDLAEVLLPDDRAQAKKTRDPRHAKDLSARGMAAYRKGQFDVAEGLFHRALGANRRDATALGGLAEIHFERGSYQNALSFATKAVRVSPRSGRFRIVLGDAYFKTYAYDSARREYEKAKSLGHRSAAARLSQLDKRLGR